MNIKTHAWIKQQINKEKNDGIFNDYTVSTVVKQTADSLEKLI